MLWTIDKIFVMLEDLNATNKVTRQLSDLCKNGLDCKYTSLKILLLKQRMTEK